MCWQIISVWRRLGDLEQKRDRRSSGHEASCSAKKKKKKKKKKRYDVLRVRSYNNYCIVPANLNEYVLKLCNYFLLLLIKYCTL
jgi:hypothetical protein